MQGINTIKLTEGCSGAILHCPRAWTSFVPSPSTGPMRSLLSHRAFSPWNTEEDPRKWTGSHAIWSAGWRVSPPCALKASISDPKWSTQCLPSQHTKECCGNLVLNQKEDALNQAVGRQTVYYASSLMGRPVPNHQPWVSFGFIIYRICK